MVRIGYLCMVRGEFSFVGGDGEVWLEVEEDGGRAEIGQWDGMRTRSEKIEGDAMEMIIFSVGSRVEPII